jgi:hypothetical protein
MSFIKSKHSGWTWDLKRTPFGGGGDPFQQIGDVFAGIDKSVGQAVPGGWGTIGGAALLAAGVYDPELLSLGESGQLSPEALQSAGVDQATIDTLAQQAPDLSGFSQAPLDTSGIPSDVLAQYTGGAPIDAGTQTAIEAASAPTYGVPPSTSIAGAEQLAAGGGLAGAGAGEAAGGGLSNILGTASGVGGILAGLNALSQIAGGGARVAGGQQAQQTAQQVKQLVPQAAPFQPYQSQLASQLFNLLQNPSTITSTPGYQFNLQQGLQAQQAQQAAQGRLVSGGALLEANKFGQQYATSQLAQQEDLLAKLTGAYQSPAAAAGVQGGLLAGGLGGQLGGAQAMAGGFGTASGGLGNIVSPLATLYSLYNQPSPDQQVQ